MNPVIIRVRDNGPFLIEGGPITIIDADGNTITTNPAKPNVALCRCGQSKNRPFCDGSHKGCGFLAVERAPKLTPPAT